MDFQSPTIYEILNKGGDVSKMVGWEVPKIVSTKKTIQTIDEQLQTDKNTTVKVPNHNKEEAELSQSLKNRGWLKIKA